MHGWFVLTRTATGTTVPTALQTYAAWSAHIFLHIQVAMGDAAAIATEAFSKIRRLSSHSPR